MDEYIKRTDAMAVICSFCGLDEVCEDRTVCRIQEKLHELPVADVRPVVHGKWIWYETALFDSVLGYAIKCSACKEVFTETDVSQKPMEYSFCPNCGADMREAE